MNGAAVFDLPVMASRLMGFILSVGMETGRFVAGR